MRIAFNSYQTTLTFSLLLSLVFVATTSLANPSHKDTNLALAIHGRELTKALHATASGLDSKAREKVIAFLKQESANRIEQISAKDIGQTHLATTQLLRAAEQLLYLGEPSGLDFQKRVEQMRVHIARITQKSKSVPATQKYISQWRIQIQKTAAARAKSLEQITKLCNDAKWDNADDELNELFDSMEPGTVFFESEEKKDIYLPFSGVQGAIMNAMRDLRKQRGAEQLQQAIAATTPDHPAIIDEMMTAVAAIGESGRATYRDVEVTGPELVTKIADTWRDSQNAILQARAKQWALDGRPAYAGSFYPTQGSNDAEDPFAKAHLQFSDAVIAQLTRLIQVDAARTTSEAAPALYIEYLRALAPLARQHANREFTPHMTQALGVFGNKLPAGGRNVGSYALATTDLLRWRAKVASARTVAQQSNYPALPTVFKKGTISKAPYVGLFPEDTSFASTAQLMAASTETMPVAVQQLMGQPALVRDVIRISDSSPTAIARYADRTYANIPAGAPPIAAIAALKRDLLITDQLPPLTLAATQAVVSAERGDWLAVGGEISGTYLEAVVSRFGSLPSAAAILTPLGVLPAENLQNGSLAQMMMRFDITPKWMAYEYFFVAP